MKTLCRATLSLSRSLSKEGRGDGVDGFGGSAVKRWTRTVVSF